MALFGLGRKKPAKKKPAKKAVKKVKKKIKKISKKPVKKAKKTVKGAVAKKIIKKPAPKKEIKKVAKKEIKQVKLEEVRMDERKAFDLVKSSKIPVLSSTFIKNSKEMEMNIGKVGLPCIMKVSSKFIESKAKVSGVMKISSKEELIDSFAKLMKINGAEGVMIQPDTKGIELILKASNHPSFGKVISIAVGGEYSKIMKDVSFRIAPISTTDAEDMVRELKLFGVLESYNSGKSINFEKLHEIIVKLGNFSIKNNFKEVEINPLIANDEGCYSADIKIRK